MYKIFLELSLIKFNRNAKLQLLIILNFDTKTAQYLTDLHYKINIVLFLDVIFTPFILFISSLFFFNTGK